MGPGRKSEGATFPVTGRALTRPGQFDYTILDKQIGRRPVKRSITFMDQKRFEKGYLPLFLSYYRPHLKLFLLDM